MPATLTKTDEALYLDLSTCRGAEFQDTLAKIKEIPGRRFDADTKLWAVPPEATLAERIMLTIQPNASEDIREWIKLERITDQQALTTPLDEDADLLVPWARKRAKHQPTKLLVGDTEIPFKGLLQHQRPVVDVAAARRKLIIADDMGLGKTGAMISAVEEHVLRQEKIEKLPPPEAPKLVICPTSVMGTWRREVKLWLDEDAVLVNGTTPKARENRLLEGIEANAWVVVNWEQIRAAKELVQTKRKDGSVSKKKVEKMKQPIFETTDWLAVIADEVHRAKNRKAQVTRGLWRIKGDLQFAASGTPLMNSPDELWSILRWLWPDEYTSYWRFYEQYVDYTEGYYGKIITGVKNPDALRFELKTRLVRRTQGQVLDLPGKVRIPVPVTLNPKQQKLYDKAEAELWLEVEQAIEKGDTKAEQLAAAALSGEPISRVLRLPNGAARTVRLRQIMESPALLGADDDSAVLDACVDKILDSGGEQWAVFCEFAGTPELMVNRLAKKNVKAVAYTGSVDPQERAEIERRYQAGEIQVVIGTIKSMYQGITLTAGHHQFWISRDWVPDVNEQGEDRQNRIGQDERVLVYIAEPEGTIAVSKIAPLNRVKERIVRSVVVKDNIDQKGVTE